MPHFRSRTLPALAIPRLGPLSAFLVNSHSSFKDAEQVVPPPGSPPCFHSPTPSLLIQLLQPFLDSAEKTHSGDLECDALRD